MIPFLQNIRMLIAYAELRPLSNPIGTGRYLQTFLTYRIYFNIDQWHVRPPYFKELVGNIRLNTVQAKLAKNIVSGYPLQSSEKVRALLICLDCDPGGWFQGSGFSAAADRRSGQFDRNRDSGQPGLIRALPLARKMASLIEIETSNYVKFHIRFQPEFADT